jgi:hypothetical protein
MQEFPLHLLPGLQTDGRRQCQREAHVKPGFLSVRTDGLHAQRVGCIHFFGQDSTIFLASKYASP